jgi:UDP-glucose:glycoprotein glucosyltransferase
MHSHLLLATAFLAAGVRATSPPVKVALRSSWSAPSFLVELLETVGLESPDAFFPLLDRLTDPENAATQQKLSPEALQQYVLDTAVSNRLLVQPGSVASTAMNLALHAATPKIEAFYQYYATSKEEVECGSWVDWYGTVVCDVETLAQLAGIDTIDPADSTSDSYVISPIDSLNIPDYF